MRQTGLYLSYALTALSLVSGCVSVERATRVTPAGVTLQGTPGTPTEYVHVSNFGYYLFNRIPLFCGNTATDRHGNTIWFSDEVTLAKTQDIMINHARSRNCHLAEIQPYTRSTCFLRIIPYVGTTFGILWYKEVQMSAVLVRPDAPASPRGHTR